MSGSKNESAKSTERIESVGRSLRPPPRGRAFGRGRGSLANKKTEPNARPAKVNEAITINNKDKSQYEDADHAQEHNKKEVLKDNPPQNCEDVPDIDVKEAITIDKKDKSQYEDPDLTQDLNKQLVLKDNPPKNCEDVPAIVSPELNKKQVLKDNPPKNCEDVLDIVAQSTLSPLAPEFIPKVAKEKCYEEMKAIIESSLAFCHSALKESPAEFDAVMVEVMPELMKCTKDKNLIELIANQLFFDALMDVSYAYFAVKIYVEFINNAKIISPEDSTVRDVILDLCSSHLHHLLDVQLESNARWEEESNVFPLLMFAGELYLQTYVGGSRLQPIGGCIISISKKLMAADYLPLEQRLLDITSVIKLIGPSLEEEFSVQMNELLGPLWIKMYDAREEISKSTYEFVDKLINLRYSYWSPRTKSGNESHNCTDDTAIASNMPVFYGPDGEIIGHQEQLFLESYSEQEPSPIDQQSEISDTMDDEMAEAYEEFLSSLPGETYHTPDERRY